VAGPRGRARLSARGCLGLRVRALPEREPHPAIHDALNALIGAMEMAELGSAWVAAYVKWELGVLAELGFGLNLEHCAVTGNNDELAYVSPRSGRAVSLSAGEPYREKLLTLPDFLIGRGGGEPEDLLAGMKLTGFFLERHVFGAQGEAPLAARDRFLERLRGTVEWMRRWRCLRRGRVDDAVTPRNVGRHARLWVFRWGERAWQGRLDDPSWSGPTPASGYRRPVSVRISCPRTVSDG